MGIDPSSFGGKFACLQHASANRDAEKDAQRKHAKKKEKSTSLAERECELPWQGAGDRWKCELSGGCG